MSTERTLPATPRRREQAHRRGLLPTNEGLAWIASTATLTALLPLWLQSVTASFTTHLRQLPVELAAPEMPLGPLATGFGWQVMWPTIMVLAAASATGIGVRLFLDRPRVAFERLAAFERLQPWNGLQRLASRETARQILTSLVAVVLLAVAMRWSFAAVWDHAQQASLDPHEQGQVGMWLAWQGLLGTLLAAGVLVAVQQVLRWRASERRLRMTAEEFRDEQRLLEAGRRVHLPTRDAPEDPRSPFSRASTPQ